MTKMVIRKLFRFGGSWAITLPPAFMHFCQIEPGDILSVELGAGRDIIVRKVDLQKLHQESTEYLYNTNDTKGPRPHYIR